MEKSGSTMKRLFFTIAFLFVAGMGLSIYLSFQPQNLSGISGYDPNSRTETVVDIPARIEAAAKTRQPVTISEGQFNTWLANHIKVRQEGKLADEVDLKGVWVRFSSAQGGRAEIVIEREVREMPHTTSIYLRLERKEKEDGSFTTTRRLDGGRFLGAILIGGRFGELKVPQGFLFFTQSSYRSLARLFTDEIDHIEKDIIKAAGGEVIFEDQKMRIEFPEDSK